MSGTAIRITLHAAPGSDALRGVRQILKTAWRAHRLKCTKLELIDEADAQIEDTTKAAELRRTNDA
jgi:hypothetical protein